MFPSSLCWLICLSLRSIQHPSSALHHWTLIHAMVLPRLSFQLCVRSGQWEALVRNWKTKTWRGKEGREQNLSLSLPEPPLRPSPSLWFGGYFQQRFVSSVALAPYHASCSHQAVWPWSPAPTASPFVPPEVQWPGYLPISGLALCPLHSMWGSTRVKYTQHNICLSL